MNPKYQKLIGQKVKALGDCGMKKDIEVSGELGYNYRMQYFYVIIDKGQYCSINEKTIEVL